MKKMALETGVLAAGVLATGLMAASGVQAMGFTGGYAGGYLAQQNFTGSSGSEISYAGFFGHNFFAGPDATVGFENELNIAPQSSWASGTVVSDTVSARAGLHFGRALVYARLGAGYSTANTGYWLVGAGIDYRLAVRVFLRAEADQLTPSASGLGTDNEIRLGVGVRF